MADHDTPTGLVTRRWLMNYSNYSTFVERNGALPKESATLEALSNEAKLAFWARYQRRRFTRGRMPRWQKELLGVVPGFSWDPSEERWSALCAQLAAFLTEKGQMPRYRAPDDGERRLAAWVHKQRHIAASGRMPNHRIDALRRLPFKIV